MAQFKQSDRVREIVVTKYVQPALNAGKTRLSIRVRDVLKDAEATSDFPRGRTPLVCNVLQSNKLLKGQGLEIERVDGPPSKQSRTVVVHYRIVDQAHEPASQNERVDDQPGVIEDSAAWAKRVTSKMAGLLKDELAAYGGGDAFMKWVRSDGEEDE